MNRLLVTIVVVAVMSSVASAQQAYTWTGGTDNDFHNTLGGNWNPVPTLPATCPGILGGGNKDDSTIFTGAGTTYTVDLSADVDDGSGGWGVGRFDVSGTTTTTMNLNGKTYVQDASVGLLIHDTAFLVGVWANDNATMIIDGNGDTNSTFKAEGGIKVGWEGVGQDGVGHLLIKNSAQVYNTEAHCTYVHSPAGPDSTLVVDGAGTYFEWMGGYFGKGSLTVQNGALMDTRGSSTKAISYFGFMSPLGGGQGPFSLNVTGEGSTYQHSMDNNGGQRLGYGSGASASINVTDGGQYLVLDGGGTIGVGYHAGATASVTVTGKGALGTGSYMLVDAMELGGRDNTVYIPNGPGDYGDGKHCASVGTLTVGKDGRLDVDSRNAAQLLLYPSDLVVYNSNSTINNAGLIVIYDGSLLMNGTSGNTGGPGNLNIDIDPGQIVVKTAGETADVAGVDFDYLLNGGTSGAYAPTLSACIDFIIADTISDAGADHAAEMTALMGSVNAGAGYGSWQYSKVIIGATDYASGAYAGYDALRLSVLPGDADNDAAVGFSDFQKLLDNWGTGTAWVQGDFDYDGAVGFSDFQILLDNWGDQRGVCSGMAPPAPEPATMVLLGMGGLALLRRRRR